jgi:hypothetical protein
MKVICTLKNSPSPHIHDNATEFPQSSAFNQRKFIKSAKEPSFPRTGKPDSQRISPRSPRNQSKIRLETAELMERLTPPAENYH